jgi:hypothetical protein
MTENIDAVLADWQGSLDAMRWAPDLPEEPVPAASFYDQTAETFNSAADDGFYSRYSTGPDAIWIPVISDPVRERFGRGCHYDTDGDGNCHLCARCGSCFHPD